MYTDTHCHINSEAFDDILEDVLDDCVDALVDEIFIMGDTKESTIKAVNIKEKYDGYKGIAIIVFGGIHPTEIKEEQNYEWLEKLIEEEKVEGIGEIGLDMHWDKTFKDLQISEFKKQLEIARKYNLPVSVHTRDAIELTYDVMKDYKDVRAVIHCFTGSVEMAHKFVDLGFMLGIGGVVTFKNSNLYQVVEEISIENLVIETDSPYLAPHPLRGKMNKPSYIPYIIKKVAEIKGIGTELAAEYINDNIEILLGF